MDDRERGLLQSCIMYIYLWFYAKFGACTQSIFSTPNRSQSGTGGRCTPCLERGRTSEPVLAVGRPPLNRVDYHPVEQQVRARLRQVHPED